MPLFFLLAGVFACTINNKGDGWRLLVKDAKRLLLPVLVTMFFVVMLSPLHYYTDGNLNYTIIQILSTFWAGDTMMTRWGSISCPMWFLVSLFWVRVLFRTLERLIQRYSIRSDALVVGVCVLLSFVVVLTEKHIPPTPWGILKALPALSFYSIGWYLRRHKLPIYVYVFFVFVWLCALKWGGIDMYYYRFDCFPIDVLGAIGATWLIYLISTLISKVQYINRVFLWLGVNSMIVYCMNFLDRHSYLIRIVKSVFRINISGVGDVAFRLMIGLLLVV